MRRYAFFLFLFFSVSAVAAAPAGKISPDSLSVTVNFSNIQLVDLARVVYGDLLKESFSLGSDFISGDDKVTVNWRNLSHAKIKTLTDDLISSRGYMRVVSGGVVFVKKISRDDDDILIYRPRNRSAKYLADILSKVAKIDPIANASGNQNLNKFAGPFSAGSFSLVDAGDLDSPAQPAKRVANAPASKLPDLTAFDQMAYACLPARCVVLRKLLSDLDTKEAQIVIKAALYEVGTTKGEGSAMQIVGRLLDGKLTLSLGAAAAAGTASVQIASLGLDAVLAVLDQDSRFKVVSRPQLRVRTGAQARFSVGQQVPVLGAISYDKNGNSLQSVDYRQSGTIFTVRPDIRDEVVDLDISQELSSFVTTTTGVNNTPTLLQRTASSQLSIKPGEVVVFAGLEESRDEKAGSNFFGFSLGSRENNSSSEVLLFIEAQPI